jgi:uncharacterized protein YlxW (UPF0749 family)
VGPYSELAVQAAKHIGREGDCVIVGKLIERLRVFTGVALLALALILGGCGGNEAQEEQQDVKEEQEDVQEAQKELEQEQKDVEEEQQDVEQEKQEIREEQQDEK